MQTIGAILGSQIRPSRGVTPLLPNVGCVGLELELENGRFDYVPGWVMHEDGSLRGGVEYVFNGPQGGSDALTSIENMGNAFAAMHPRPTFRCSTHCHLDVRDLTVLGVSKLFALYAINEDVMFDHCEEYRRWSNFCTPFYNAIDLVDGFAGMVRSDLHSKDKRVSGATSVLNMRAFPKYSAMNFQPVANFGSVEFRGSHAMTNAEELLALTQRMLHLKRVVLESPPEESLEDFTHRVNKLAIADIFQQGLREGYQRNREFADTCYSTAVRLLGALTPRVTTVPHDMAVQMPAWTQEGLTNDPIPFVPELQDAPADNLIYINEGVMARYGLRNERCMSVANFCHLFSALRNMVGVRRPSLATLIDMNRTNADLVRTLPAELARMGF